SAGARFTVMRRTGNCSAEEATAARTRSFASRTAVSGRPLSLKVSLAPPTWASTRTRRGSAPTIATEVVSANMATKVREAADGEKGVAANVAGMAPRPTSRQLVELLGLEPLPVEGGLFAQTWKSPVGSADGKPAGTAIYAMLTDDPDSFSAVH